MAPIKMEMKKEGERGRDRLERIQGFCVRKQYMYAHLYMFFNVRKEAKTKLSVVHVDRREFFAIQKNQFSWFPLLEHFPDRSVQGRKAQNRLYSPY